MLPTFAWLPAWLPALLTMVARIPVTRYTENTREEYASVNCAMVSMGKSIGSARVLQDAIRKRKPLYGYFWEYANSNERFCLSQHVTCPKRTRVLMFLCRCASIEELAALVQEHLPEAAQSRDRGRMKLKWNPEPDGDCFFSALFFACFMICAHTEVGEITTADKGVCQVFGSKHLRFLFLNYFKCKIEKVVRCLFPHCAVGLERAPW